MMHTLGTVLEVIFAHFIFFACKDMTIIALQQFQVQEMSISPYFLKVYTNALAILYS